eukprot:COSAG06_NODE_45557_length_354_cov_0.407843_1_plen_57_part_10
MLVRCAHGVREMNAQLLLPSVRTTTMTFSSNAKLPRWSIRPSGIYCRSTTSSIAVII